MLLINTNDIIPFKNHPFKIDVDNSLIELSESIDNYGLLNPVIVRQKGNKYEMVSGHRRLKAMILLGKKQIEADVRNLTDDEAIILMVDSNIQRNEILPSEKAFAYKMKLDAIKHQGKICGTKCHKSRDKVAENCRNSGRTIQQYIRLTYLIPELLKLVDDTYKYGKNQFLTMGIKPAVELSYLTKKEQKLVYAEIEYNELTPSHSQAIKIRDLAKNKQLNYDVLDKLLEEKKGNQNDKISFNKERIIKELPKELSKRDKRYIEEYIVNAIKTYRTINHERGDLNVEDM